MHALGCLWRSVRGRDLRQRLLAHSNHIVARRPTILILAEAKSKAGPDDPPFWDYTQHVMLPVDGKTEAVLDVYVHTATTTRATLLSGKEDANALVMEVLTAGGNTTC